MSKPGTGKINLEGLQLDAFCDVCQRDRAHGNHTRCSRVRQERYRRLRETESIEQANQGVTQ